MTTDNNNPKLPRIEIDEELCKGCYLCVESCSKKIITISKNFNKIGYQYIETTSEGCTGCAICYYTCPEPGAIKVFKRPKKGE